MTTTLTTTTTGSTVARTRPLWRAALVSGAVAAMATTTIAAVADAAGVSFEADGEAIPLLGFAQMTLLGAVLGLAIAALMVAGSLWAFAVSLLWPERPDDVVARVPAPTAPALTMLGYGIRLGLAGGTAAAIGFAFDFDHVGWACAAALLVMRPSVDMQRLRSAGRVVSVPIGLTSPLANTGSMALTQTSIGGFLIARTSASAFNVLTAVCTHEGCTVSNSSGSAFACPCHGSQFSTSGSVAKGPANSSLRQFPSSFDGSVLTFTG